MEAAACHLGIPAASAPLSLCIFICLILFMLYFAGLFVGGGGIFFFFVLSLSHLSSCISFLSSVHYCVSFKVLLTLLTFSYSLAPPSYFFASDTFLKLFKLFVI